MSFSVHNMFIYSRFTLCLYLKHVRLLDSFYVPILQFLDYGSWACMRTHTRSMHTHTDGLCTHALCMHMHTLA